MATAEFHSSVPVLLCQDLQVSISFYTMQLGFELVWLDEEGHDYAALARGNAGIHLALAVEGSRQPSLQNMSTCEPADVNFMISHIDELWSEYSAKGVSDLMGPPADQDYGIRDFSLIAPDGYQIRFNQFVG